MISIYFLSDGILRHQSQSRKYTGVHKKCVTGYVDMGQKTQHIIINTANNDEGSVAYTCSNYITSAGKQEDGRKSKPDFLFLFFPL